MFITDFIASIFKPATDLVDDLHTSTEEKLQLRNKLAEIQEEANQRLLELEKARLDAMAKVEAAEAGSAHWLKANWRPITSLALVGLIIADSFEVVVVGQQVYDLAHIFLGAYTTSRGLEKVAKVIKLGGK